MGDGLQIAVTPTHPRVRKMQKRVRHQKKQHSAVVDVMVCQVCGTLTLTPALL